MSDVRGSWQVSASDSIDLGPAEWEAIRDRVVEATERGESMIVVDGITLRWVEAEPTLDIAKVRRALGVIFTDPFRYADGHLASVLHDDAAERFVAEYSKP